MEASIYKVAEINISYHSTTMKEERPTIITASDAVFCLLEGYNRDTMDLQEQFVVIYLNRANQVLGLYKASTGGITGTVADIRLILSVALKIGALSLIISHNHPSGILKPSRSDEALTGKLKQAATVMDIKLLDHLILDSKGSYYSFADEGLI